MIAIAKIMQSFVITKFVYLRDGMSLLFKEKVKLGHPYHTTFMTYFLKSLQSKAVAEGIASVETDIAVSLDEIKHQNLFNKNTHF